LNCYDWASNDKEAGWAAEIFFCAEQYKTGSIDETKV
jgi:hypothetical protein